MGGSVWCAPISPVLLVSLIDLLCSSRCCSSAEPVRSLTWTSDIRIQFFFNDIGYRARAYTKAEISVDMRRKLVLVDTSHSNSLHASHLGSSKKLAFSPGKRSHCFRTRLHQSESHCCNRYRYHLASHTPTELGASFGTASNPISSLKVSRSDRTKGPCLLV